MIHLDVLSQGMPGLTSAGGQVLAEAAAVCLENQRHPTGVTITLSGLAQPSANLNWQVVDDQCRRCHNDLQEATERGACGIAILVIKEMVGLVVVNRSVKGTGFDYWLGEGADSFLFENKSRLEVSGILSGTQALISSRMKQKKQQSEISDHWGSGYVAVVEFGQPTAVVEIK